MSPAAPITDSEPPTRPAPEGDDLREAHRSKDQREQREGIISPEPDRRAVTPWQPGSVAAPCPCPAAKAQGSRGPRSLQASCFTVRLFGLHKLKGRCTNKGTEKTQKKHITVVFHAAAPMTERH